MLLLGEIIGANNRYTSYDPLTFKPKTTRIQNGDRISSTLIMEHYNRAVIDQGKWDTTVVNRFELRAMGTQTGVKHDERSIVQSWIDRLRSIESTDISRIESTLNAGIFSEWETHAKNRGSQNSKTDFNSFLRFKADHIYTRNQLKDLCSLFGKGDSEKAVQNLISKERSGNCFSGLYTPREIKAAVDSMVKALIAFMEN